MPYCLLRFRREEVIYNTTQDPNYRIYNISMIESQWHFSHAMKNLLYSLCTVPRERAKPRTMSVNPIRIFVAASRRVRAALRSRSFSVNIPRQKAHEVAVWQFRDGDPRASVDCGETFRRNYVLISQRNCIESIVIYSIATLLQLPVSHIRLL